MFGSFGAGFGSFGAGVGGLLPSFTNITSWLKAPTADGKTLANSKGTDANLTGVNCLNLDGVNDEVNTGYNPSGDLIIDARIKADTVTGTRTIHSCNGNAGYFFRINNGEWQLYAGGDGFVVEGSTGIDPEVDNIYDTRVEYTASSNAWVVKIKLSTDSTYTTVGSGTKTPTFSSSNVILGQKGSSGYLDGEFYSFKLTEGGNVKVHYPFAEGSGTKTFDVSGSGNHGLITGATWTTEDGIESWNHEYGFDTDIFKGYRGYWDLPSSGSGTWTRNESNLTLTGNTGTSGRIRQVVDGMVSGDTLVVSGTITQTTAQGGGVDIAISSASAGWVEGTVFLGGQLGTYTFSKTFNANSSTCDIQFVALGGANAIISDLKFTVVKKIPALNTKTTQVATFDGVADKVDFASALLDSASTFTVRFDIHKFERTAGNFHWVVGGLAGANFGLNKGGVMFYRAGDNTYLEFDGTGNTTDTSNLDLDGKSIVVKGSNDVIELFIDTVSYGTVTANSGQGVYTASRYGQGYVNASHNFKGSLSRVALWNTANDGQDLSTALVNHEFQSDIGTTTVQDTTANNNDGTVTVGSGGTATFWGTRVADTAGSLVSADYNVGNTTISNPAGFVHNGSECGVAMVTHSLTSTQLFQIDNSTATETFVRKNNGNIVQILDYSAPLTGNDLARTKSYVG